MQEFTQKIPKSVWDNIQKDVEEYVESEDEKSKLWRQKILRNINKSLIIYPNSIDLLATKADYLKRSKDRENCLLQAYAMAKQLNDFKNQTLISSSLAAFYIDDLDNFSKGIYWISQGKAALLNFFDEDEQRELIELELKLSARESMPRDGS